MEEPIVSKSPSEKYELSISLSKKIEGYWQWSIGKIKALATNEYISIVHRNYSHFPFAWVENHKDGHDYLICGEDYQGQTIVQLDTGFRKDYLPVSADEGWGFCWIEIVPDGTQLIVEGCYWGAPYERVWYDFSEPMSFPYKELQREEIDLEEDEEE